MTKSSKIQFKAFPNDPSIFFFKYMQKIIGHEICQPHEIIKLCAPNINNDVYMRYKLVMPMLKIMLCIRNNEFCALNNVMHMR